MPMNVKEIEKEALRLSSHERALPVKPRIGSLEPDEDPDAERAWIEEAERRCQEYLRLHSDAPKGGAITSRDSAYH